MTSTDALIDAHDRYLSPNYRRHPVAIERGEGAELFDVAGRRYIDLFAGFGAGLLGHAHPALVKAVSDQARRLWHVGNLLHTRPQVELAERIARLGFGGQSFFCHSGADANEAAIKLARLYGGARPGPAGARHKIITMHNAFHGRSFATMAATGQEKVRAGFAPDLAGFTQVPFGDAEALENALDEQTVAVLLEPIQGEGGVNVPEEDYLPAVRRLCDARDLLLIVDEVWTGGGRTGRWFAHQHSDLVPDVMTLAKGVGGGLPVGVMCARPEHAALFDAGGVGGVRHATTLGGNCLAMAAGAAVFETLERENLPERAAALEERIRQRLAGLEPITEVRGRGLFLGLALAPPADAPTIARTCLEQGLVVNATGNRVLRLAPPLTISDAVLEEGLATLETVMREAPSE